MFLEGSYWIYENNKNHELDSIVLSYAEKGHYWNPPAIHGQAGIKREYYKMLFNSNTNNYQDIDLIESDRVRRNPETEWYTCGRSYYSPEPSLIYEYFDSLVIGDNVFHDIVKCKINADNYVDGCSNAGFILDTDLYTAPDYGIVRKVVYDNDSITSWDLIRWKIEILALPIKW